LWERQLEDRERLLGGADALGAGVVVGAQQPERQVGLRGQDQDHQRRAQGDVCSEQLQPDGHRDQGHRDRGHQLEDQRGQERHPQSGHGRPAVAIGDLADRTDLGLGSAEHLQRR
jgi:hypothetical protein